MRITLYQFGKRVNSTLKPNDNIFHEVVENVQLKEDTSLYNPTFLLSPKWRDLRYNYLLWDNRYYYIDDIVKPNIKDVWEYHCSIDLLATFKADILDTIAYIKYSKDNYDISIPDDRISFPVLESVSVYDKEVFASELDTTITIQYISASDSYYGSVATAVLTTDNLRSLNALLMSESFGDSLSKQIDSTASAIVGCKLFPIAINGDLTKNMTILSTQTSISAGIITGNGLRRGTWTILTTDQLTSLVGSSNFKNFEPYTTYKLYLPAYGYIEVSPSYLLSLLKTSRTFDIKYILDVINGSMTYVIWGLGKFDCAFAVNIPTAYSGINAINTISSGINAVASVGDALFGGGLTNIASNAFNTAVAATQKICGTIGSSSGSMASIMSDPMFHSAKDFHIQLIKQSLKERRNSTYDTKAVHGSPNNTIDKLSNYTGYVQTVNISVASNLPKLYADELNDLIDNGIFIE